ncbi:MAG: hypothetical protein II116_05620, partial [Ruminococcus sp.]|nr:hypothetical protein [Ruminococcus sp.]
ITKIIFAQLCGKSDYFVITVIRGTVKALIVPAHNYRGNKCHDYEQKGKNRDFSFQIQINPLFRTRILLLMHHTL